MFIDRRYEVLERLGSGNWANIYKVRDVRSGSLYTLKLFQYLSSEDLYKNFAARDMHRITKIDHPNLSQVLDFGHVGDHIYFISEYFDGSVLSAFRFSKNKVNQLYDIIIQVCYALNALHSQNLLHRDLKPDNILFKTTGSAVQVKLIDYGFSRLALDKDKQYVSGTLPYIAPEIYLGQDIGQPSDFYSLGVVIYRLTTGNFPFSLDQINALRSGAEKYFIPIFPSEMNDQIPLELEKLMLRLLERRTENRFQNSEEVINYINRTTDRSYPFSASWSLVNALQFNSYTVREEIVGEILSFLPLVEGRNGKVITVLGGEGLGKDNILSLFRYNVLRGAYFIFDYSCTRTDHEAFFALIKEYLQSLAPELYEEEQKAAQISDKLREYLFGSAEEAKNISQTSAELQIDFEYAKSLLVRLSQDKPLLFIIRNLQHVHRYTLEFLNFISAEVVKNRIFILLSCTDYNKIKQLQHTVLVQIPMFTPSESEDYIRKLMNSEVPQDFCIAVHQRSSGNPFFIREILIDLTLRKQLTYDKTYQYPANLDDYVLPGRILHSIYSRLSHLTQDSYQQLQQLSVVQTPIDLDLIRYICKVQDSELYQLLNDARYNEILCKQNDYYVFSYPEAKARLYSECKPRMQKLVSLRVLKYFSNTPMTSLPIVRGLIENARIAEDPAREREQLGKLYTLLMDERSQEQAYDTAAAIMDIDLAGRVETSPDQWRADIQKMLETTEYTGLQSKSAAILDQASGIPECSDKYLLLGTLETIAGKTREAVKHFTRAVSLSTGQDQKDKSRLYLIQTYCSVNLKKAQELLRTIEVSELSLVHRILYTELEARLLMQTRDFETAINLLEGFLHGITPDQDIRIILQLAYLHAQLGECYSMVRNIPEATEHLNSALSTWKRFRIHRPLGKLYNQIADLYLKQGYTELAMQNAMLGLHSTQALNQLQIKAQTLLIMGEAKIKLGEFFEAEAVLLESQQLLDAEGSSLYREAIQRNLALAKSKIVGFGYYYDYVRQTEPKLLEGIIQEINPLVKTYFYYLSEMPNPRKLRRLFSKNAHIDYTAIQELEFYHNVQSMLASAEKRYDEALKELKQAMQIAGDINNHYAISVFKIMQAACYYGMQDYAKAQDTLLQARPEIEEYRYRYWICFYELIQIKLQLVDPLIHLRAILRDVDRLLKTCLTHQYYQLAVELMQIRIQLLLEFSAEAQAQESFKSYQAYLEKVTHGIAEDDRNNFLKVNHYFVDNLKKIRHAPLVSRKKSARSKWNDLLYNTVNVSSIQQVKLLIEKGISQVLAPWQFKLMVYSENLENYYSFVCHNCDPEVILPPEFGPHIERAFSTNSLTGFKHGEQNVLITPLATGGKRIGYLILSDAGELDFTASELAVLRNMKTHLTALIIRTWDYQDITVATDKMRLLVNTSHELLRTLDMNELEHSIVSAALDFTNCTRGFLIKRDEEGNNLYKVQMDHTKQLISTTTGISKTALSLCQNSSKVLITYNALAENIFQNSISVQDYAINSIFCSPIIVDNTPVGYLYLDNYGDSTRETYLNEELLDLLINQFSIAIKNASQYQGLLKKSAEMNAIEALKDEFIAIVSHELNTPLSSLQGYITRLKRNLYADIEERDEIMQKLEQAVNRISMSVSDITTMNTYNLTKSLQKSPLNIADVINLVHQEIEIQSRQRHMIFKIDIEKGLPPLTANWEALHRLVYNIVINAVRFTNEFGTITISARKSIYPQEKIANKDTLVVNVKDNGIGIPAYQLKDIFRKFYELNEIYAHKSGTIEYRSSGLGLGLAIARRIADLHGGEIAIKSKENEGTTVSILIPF